MPCVISLDWFDETQETLAIPTPCNPIGEVIQLIAQCIAMAEQQNPRPVHCLKRARSVGALAYQMSACLDQTNGKSAAKQISTRQVCRDQQAIGWE